jgi:hypothetical protein
MGEEKKASKDSKKMKYEVPKLVNLNKDAGVGLCGTGVRGNGPTICGSGSGEDITCITGSTATAVCIGFGVDAN